MLSHAAYKLVHLAAILMLFSGIGGLWAISRNKSAGDPSAARKVLMALHGVALLLILVGGFGMLARLGLHGGWPPWVWIKIVLWLVIGAWPVVLRRIERPSTLIFLIAPILGAIAAWAALFHIGAAQ